MLWRSFRALVLVSALFCAGSATALPKVEDPALAVPTAADFGALPFFTNPRLSPDGTHLAARGLVRGEKVVVIADISAPQLKLDLIAIPEKHDLEWVRWAGNDKVLVSLSRSDFLFGEEVRITRLISTDIHTHDRIIVGPKNQGLYGDDLVFVDPEGKFVLLSTQKSIYDYPSVFRVDLDSGKTKLEVGPQEGVWNWYADKSGAVRVGYGSSLRQWWVFYRANGSDRFERASHPMRDGDDDDAVQAFLPVPNTDSGFAIAKGEHGRLALFKYDFKGDLLGDLIYENPTVDVDDFDVGENGDLRNVSFTDEHDEIVWFDPELKKVQAGLDRAMPDMVNYVVSTSRDHSRVLIFSSSSTNPGSYLLLDRKTHELRKLADAFSKLVGKRLAEMKPVRYQARDGLEIRGYLTLPPGRGATGLPLVVVPHGGPFARDTLGYDVWAQYLASKGYAVLQPNFRGSTGFGIDFVKKGDGQWGRGMQDDVIDGVKWLAAKGTIDPKRVCIMGGSYGGYAAMWATVRDADVFRCAISFAGVADVAAQLRYNRKDFAASRYFRNWRARVQGDGASLDELSPLKFADKIKMPLLLAHGLDDDTVPPWQTRRLHDALVKLGQDHEYVTYEGEGHGFSKPEDSTDFLNRVGAFLDKYNPS